MPVRGKRRTTGAVPVGALVRTPYYHLGIGKVVESGGAQAHVAFFDSVAEPQADSLYAAARDLVPVRIAPETRCYWRANGSWKIGRVVDDLGDEYTVRAPRGEEFFLAESEIFVRWQRPIADPVEVLIVSGAESPHHHNRRRPFVDAVVEQRAASRGMPTLLSSVVELHRHQVEVVRRVLEDPIQRYLLADEVGLGKTIEAGMVVRQCLLDRPNGQVVVIVPPSLVDQWREELEEKFVFDDFPDAELIVRAHDEPENWAEYVRADLLVVDEAHHIAAGHTHEDADLAFRYQAARRLAHAVPRLLLLSATPVLHNETDFLAMLHLLDPQIHRIDDIDGFRARVASRQPLADVFFTMRPDDPAFLLHDSVTQLRELLPDDRRLQDLVDELDRRIEAVGADEPGGAREAEPLGRPVVAIRAHLGETHRVHRRLLRTRREAVVGQEFPVRGRVLPARHADDDSRRPALEDWFDLWRERFAVGLGTRSFGEDGAADELTVFRAILGRLLTDPSCLRDAVRFRLAPTVNDAASMADLSGPERVALQRVPVSEAERESLERLDGLFSEVDLGRVDQVAAVALDQANERSVVVFSGFSTVARRIADRLAKSAAECATATHLSHTSPDENAAAVRRFRDDPNCALLVCDTSGEEGLNLQFADLIVHADLPLSVARLEQRMGRLDRFGGGEPAQSIVFVDPVAHSHTTAWLDALEHGFGAFTTSTASLQHVLEEVEDDALNALATGGPEQLAEHQDDLRVRLEAELQAVQRQDALDALPVVEHDDDLYSALEASDSNWQSFREAADGLISEKPGNFRLYRRVNDRNPNLVEYAALAPRARLGPLIPIDVLADRFLPFLSQPERPRPASYRRVTATHHPGVRLLRAGDGFIDALSEFCDIDDRGRVFGMWRHRPGLEQDRLTAFRFDFLIEADDAQAATVLRDRDPGHADVRALRRRADGYLPPVTRTVWVDQHGEPIEDELQILLTVPYDPRAGDYNLSRRWWALEIEVPQARWEQACRQAADRARSALLADASLQLALEESARMAHQTMHATLEQRRARVEAGQGAGEGEDLHTEEALADAFLEGIRQPRMRLDSVGVVVISNDIPEGPGFTDDEHDA